jgi:arylsulfatase A-like enzyme
MALNVDIAPTILDFAGIAVPEPMQGRSLRPLLEADAPAHWRQSILYAYYENSWALAGLGAEARADPSFQYFTPHRIGPHRGVRTQRHKLIEYYGEGKYWELFDLQQDPNELLNLFGQPGQQDVTAELTGQLRKLQEQFHENG